MAESIMSVNWMFILLAEPSATTNEGRCLQVSNTDQSTLWHYRYGETELDWGENIEINENTAEGGEIIEEPTEPVEPAAEVNCPTVAAPDLAIREGRNRHPPAWNKYYGAKATISVWNPRVQDPKEFSLSQIWILGGPDSNLNTIEVGWTVYPHLFGDDNTRLFTYWTSDNYRSTGCYNLHCSGFVQTNSHLALGGSLNPFSTYHGSQFEITILVWKDPKQNLWWLKYGTEIIGYWPTSLFKYLKDSASLIEWGGEVLNNKLNGQHTTTKMGSGHFAEEGYQGASYFRNLQVVDGSNHLRPPGVIRVIAERPKCYNILLQKNNNWGDYFFYGGPGRNHNCP
ncbi:hypothetical protein ACH5RR_000856 [Cinchona calisaya]|uniref:Neprosin PEP catalytic domain-containing protein n=1 Tax=Cinchona calisaya TaxID=153742 RepID=A0ABD3B1T6_9GENT